MDFSLLSNVFDASVMFFFFGLFAVLVGSNLEIPPVLAKSCSLYLLLAIGFKGGVSLNQSGITATMLLALLAAVLVALAIPLYSYFILRRRVSPFDAAAIAATYGSVSAVTFIAATAFLTNAGVPFGGYMTVALVAMESPAIIMAVMLSAMVRRHAPLEPAKSLSAAAHPAVAPGGVGPHLSPLALLKEALTDGANLLLLGSLVIGAVTGAAGQVKLQTFTGGIFTGVLAFFLLDMGLVVGRRLKEARNITPFLVGFAIVTPLVNAALAGLLALLFGLDRGDALLLAVLSASASYIVVPAVVRYAIPEANPGIYLTMSLGITFPFNLTVGIPLYYQAISWLLGG